MINLSLLEQMYHKGSKVPIIPAENRFIPYGTAGSACRHEKHRCYEESKLIWPHPKTAVSSRPGKQQAPLDSKEPAKPGQLLLLKKMARREIVASTSHSLHLSNWPRTVHSHRVITAATQWHVTCSRLYMHTVSEETVSLGHRLVHEEV